MIAVQLSGGLGNQLFQYATGRALAIDTDSELKLDTSFYKNLSKADTLREFELGIYPLRCNTFSAPQLPFLNNRNFFNRLLKKVITVNLVEVRERENFKFQSLTEQVSGPSVYLRGYWQSYKYFDHIRPVLMEELTPSAEPTGRNLELLRILEKRRCLSVHVRRGDYVSNPHAASFHGVCDTSYYGRALEALGKVAESLEAALVFSDDIDWCKQNLSLPLETIFVDHNHGRDAFWDLQLMRGAAAHVIANSSFSWWGAWLAKSSDFVISPRKWTQMEGLSYDDLIPSWWQQI